MRWLEGRVSQAEAICEVARSGHPNRVTRELNGMGVGTWKS